AGILEQPLAQRGGLVGLAEGQFVRRVADDVGEASRLGAVGPLELPGDGGRPLDQALLNVVAGLEVGRPGVEPALEGVGVLAGQDKGQGAETVLQGVEAGAALARGCLGPGAVLGIAAVDRGAVERGHGAGYLGCVLSPESACEGGGPCVLGTGCGSGGRPPRDRVQTGPAAVPRGPYT